MGANSGEDATEWPENEVGNRNPTTSLTDRTRQELYNRARQLRIRGRSRMTKDELVRAIRTRS